MEPLSCSFLTQNIGGLWCGTHDSSVVAAKIEEWLTAMHTFLGVGLRRKRGIGLDCVDQGTSPVMFDVLVVHMQEVGGAVADFSLTPLIDEALQRTRPEGSWCSGLLMSCGEGASTYSATASVVFLSPRAANITSLLNFATRRFESVGQIPPSIGGDRRGYLNSRRFYGATGRKGFTHIGLRLGTRLVHCCNVHLFHDADNTVAVQTSPSPYVASRSAALVESVRAVQPFLGDDDALFIFGDFNTRLDGCRILRQLAEYNFRVERKCIVAESKFWSCVGAALLRPFDTELSLVVDAVAKGTGVELCELSFDHAPTYSLDSTCREFCGYSPTRIPAWCDRVLINASAVTWLGGWYTIPPEPLDGLAMCTYGSHVFDGMDHACVFLATS